MNERQLWFLRSSTTRGSPRLSNALLEPIRALDRLSDLHLMDGYIPFMEKGDVLGHEFMGEVVEVGADNKKLRVGDRVVVPFTICCGECDQCRKANWSVCERSNRTADNAARSTLFAQAVKSTSAEARACVSSACNASSRWKRTGSVDRKMAESGNVHGIAKWDNDEERNCAADRTHMSKRSARRISGINASADARRTIATVSDRRMDLAERNSSTPKARPRAAASFNRAGESQRLKTKIADSVCRLGINDVDLSDGTARAVGGERRANHRLAPFDVDDSLAEQKSSGACLRKAKGFFLAPPRVHGR